MTTPTNPTNPGRGRPARPTVREIAALTARLRELSARGAGADPAERAAFLADKDALIDRITAALPDTPAPAGIDRAAALRRHPEAARPDDPAEIAARVVELREPVHDANARTDEPAGGWPEFHQHRPALNRIRPVLAIPDDGADDGFSSWSGPQDAYAFGEYDHAPDDLDDQHAAEDIAWEDAAARGRRGPSTEEVVEQAHTAAAALPEPRSAAPGEADRREQLAAWHADDQAAENGAPDATRTGPDPANAREW